MKGKPNFFHCKCLSFSSSFIGLLGYHTVFKFLGEMGHTIEKEFYFRCYKIFTVKGIWLRLRTRTSPLLPILFHPSLTICCSPIHYRTEPRPCLRTYEPVVAWISMRTIPPCHCWLAKSLSLVHQFIICKIGITAVLIPLSHFCKDSKKQPRTLLDNITHLSPLISNPYSLRLIWCFLNAVYIGWFTLNIKSSLCGKCFAHMNYNRAGVIPI